MDTEHKGRSQDDFDFELTNVIAARDQPLPVPYRRRSTKRRVSLPVRSPNGLKGTLIYFDKGTGTVTWIGGAHATYQVHWSAVE